MTFAIGETYYFQFTTLDSGVPTDADSLPTGTLYVNNSSTAVSVTITKVGTGRYHGSVSLAGRSIGDRFWVEISATINSVDWPDSTPVERIGLDSGGEMIYTIMALGTSSSATAGATSLTVSGLPLDASKYANKFLVFADGSNQGIAIKILGTSSGTTVNLNEAVPDAVTSGAKVRIGGSVG